eukprot:2817668-Pleurochrysis_carterae.AAC.2
MEGEIETWGGWRERERERKRGVARVLNGSSVAEIELEHESTSRVGASCRPRPCRPSRQSLCLRSRCAGAVAQEPLRSCSLSARARAQPAAHARTARAAATSSATRRRAAEMRYRRCFLSKSCFGSAERANLASRTQQLGRARTSGLELFAFASTGSASYSTLICLRPSSLISRS